jgi:NADH-quinone oxidoreductase subunit L
LDEVHHLTVQAPLVKYSPTIAMLLGFLTAYYFYILNPAWPAAMAERKGPLYSFFYNKWYFDELYDFLFVRPAKWLGYTLWKRGDGWLIDGFGPDGIAARVLDTTSQVVRLQTGYIYWYAFVMLIGVAAAVTFFILGGGGA